ncbi:MAG TPA: hypothetical protein VFI78_07310, partial [Salinimicrobium sp.]|nr:hypothetical protein [Salinimicrobium sp.]
MAKILASISLLFVVGFFILPNVFNKRERIAFSNEIRLKEAKKEYNIKMVSDSVLIVPGPFYKRKELVESLLGSTYR